MKKAFKILIVIGVISAFILGFNKHTIESQNRTVDLVMDYEILVSEDQKELLTSLKQSGLTSVALDMSSLEDLSDDGKIILVEGDRLVFYEEITGVNFENENFPITRDSIYLLIKDEYLKRQLINVIEVNQDFNRVEFYDNVMVLPGEKKDLLEKPLLYSGEGIEDIKASALTLVPRIPDDSSLDYFLEFKNELPDFNTIIFSGEKIVGYPEKIGEVATFLMENKIRYGFIEPFVAEQEGSEILAMSMNYDNIVRVHSTGDETLDSIGVEGAVEQFSRAVEERNVRVLYLKPFEDKKETLHFVNDLTATLQESGYDLGNSTPFEFIRSQALLRYLIMISLTAFISLYSGKLNKKLPVPLFAAGVLLLLTTYTLRINMIYALAGFAIAVLIPIWIFYFLIEATEKGKGFKRAIYLYGICILSAVLGGIILQAVLLDNSYLLQVNMFRGVKAALILPFIIALLVLFYIRFGSAANFIESFYETFNRPILFKHLVIGALLLIIVAIFLSRAGNQPLISVTELELTIRNYLESFFQVRPRFKSFLIGHPLLFFGIYLTLKDKKYIWLVILGLLGPINIINSFAHVHTPIMVSLARELLGAFLGLIIGSGLIYIYRRWIEYDDKNRLFRLLRLR